jgi:hypothetical protein
MHKQTQPQEAPHKEHSNHCLHGACMLTECAHQAGPYPFGDCVLVWACLAAVVELVGEGGDLNCKEEATSSTCASQHLASIPLQSMAFLGEACCGCRSAAAAALDTPLLLLALQLNQLLLPPTQQQAQTPTKKHVGAGRAIGQHCGPETLECGPELSLSFAAMRHERLAVCVVDFVA